MIDTLNVRTYHQISLSAGCRWSTEGLVWGLWLIKTHKKRASEDTLPTYHCIPYGEHSYAESTRHSNTPLTIINPKQNLSTFYIPQPTLPINQRLEAGTNNQQHPASHSCIESTFRAFRQLHRGTLTMPCRERLLLIFLSIVNSPYSIVCIYSWRHTLNTLHSFLHMYSVDALRVRICHYRCRSPSYKSYYA